MSHLWRAKQYTKYLSKAQNRHGIHSPFVYALLDAVIYDKTKHAEFSQIEAIRSGLLARQDEIEITDLGAGSTVNKSNTRKVSDIAKNSAKGGKWGELLFRLSKHFQPETMIELGTSLGIGSLYQSLSNRLKDLISPDNSIIQLNSAFIQWEIFLKNIGKSEKVTELIESTKNYIALRCLFKARMLKGEGELVQANEYLTFGLSLNPTDRIIGSLKQELAK